MASVAVSPEPERDEHKTRPWWTEADQAELETLTWELVDRIFEHREQCERCLAHRQRELGSLPCSEITNAIKVVMDWRRARDLHSYARWIRLRRDLFELEQDRIRQKAGR